MAGNDKSTRKPSTGNAVARELNQLKKRVKELTLRLECEAKARKLDARLAAEAKSARVQLTKELAVLREQGRKLAAQLKSTLGDAGKRAQDLKEARTKAAELKAEVGRKTAELRRNSGEIKKLVEESGTEPPRSSVVIPSTPQSQERLSPRHPRHPQGWVPRAFRATSQHQPSRAELITHFSIMAIGSAAARRFAHRPVFHF
jgi:seryl-tRNA synthetase